MFSSRFFGRAYFPARYWPQGAAAPIIVAGSAHATFDADAATDVTFSVEPATVAAMTISDT